MTRARFLIVMGFALAWAALFLTSMILARHPSTPPINHCVGSDSANPWCIR